jgi:hypothetical protein
VHGKRYLSADELAKERAQEVPDAGRQPGVALPPSVPISRNVLILQLAHRHDEEATSQPPLVISVRDRPQLAQAVSR